MGYFQPLVIYRNPEDNREHSIVRYIGNRILTQNKNMLVAMVGQTGCLLYDTKLYGQTKTLKELYDSGNIFIDTISLSKAKGQHKGSYYPIKSKSEIISSGKKEVYEIEFEDGEKVIATEEHKFFLTKGNMIREEVLKNLKVGDTLRSYQLEKLDNYWKKASTIQKEKTKKNFKHQRKCKECNNLFYINLYSGSTSSRYCNHCKEELFIKLHRKKKRLKPLGWFEWEDNLIRQFYYDWGRKEIEKLMPQRNWRSIVHRASRLGIKRKPELMWEHNAFTSENNPVRKLEVRKKIAESIQKRYHENPEQHPNRIQRRNRMTQIEKKMAELLDSLGIKYEWNKYVKTFNSYKFPDFRLGNLIIECDGEYWHNKKKDKDKIREKELEAVGFRVIRFTDKQIINNLEEVKQCLIKELNQ